MVIRNINDVQQSPVTIPGVKGCTMAVMAGRADGCPNFSMRHFKVEPGGHSPRHAHDYEHEVFIVEGGGTAYFEGSERSIRSGDVIYVPADKEHQFMAGPAGLRFLCLVPSSRNCGDPTPGS
ncbi:MAG: cupin domain-containing protein [Phycisphaerales bacterium]|nr:cupin domain-containing protein [Phycisphaerales bacterium]